VMAGGRREGGRHPSFHPMPCHLLQLQLQQL
jgi:hypothetical protein